MLDQNQIRAIQMAMAVLTSDLEHPDGSMEQIMDYAMVDLTSLEEMGFLLAGLNNVALYLLAELQKTGQDPYDVLQRIALNVYSED